MQMRRHRLTHRNLILRVPPHPPVARLQFASKSPARFLCHR
uniref:Uncharacterized protein n=1 Tax=Parascaris univalens TaxID=6257 RepID=A0A915A4I6_PARUN